MNENVFIFSENVLNFPKSLGPPLHRQTTCYLKYNKKMFGPGRYPQKSEKKSGCFRILS